MTAGQIRRELDQLLQSSNASLADHQRLSDAWEAIKPDTLAAYHAVIEDRLYELNYQLS